MDIVLVRGCCLYIGKYDNHETTKKDDLSNSIGVSWFRTVVLEPRKPNHETTKKYN